ncbi:MAG: hypothetical protein R3C70_15065 [Geminicoccaceae bacterium]
MSDYLTVIEALAIHADQIEHYGGADGVRDPGLLEAALYRQFANRHHLPHHVLRDKPSAQAHSLRSSTRSLAPCFCINFSRQISMICLDRCTSRRVIQNVFHIQTVNSLHQRFHAFIGLFRGPATRYLNRYIHWFLARARKDDNPSDRVWTRLCQIKTTE